MADKAKRKQKKRVLDFEFKAERSLDGCVQILKAADQHETEYSATEVQIEQLDPTHWQFKIMREYRPLPTIRHRFERNQRYSGSYVRAEAIGTMIKTKTTVTSVYGTARISQWTRVGQVIQLGLLIAILIGFLVVAIGQEIIGLALPLMAIFCLMILFKGNDSVDNDHYINQTVSYIKQLLV